MDAAGSATTAPESRLHIRLFDGLRISSEDRLITTVDAPRLQSLLAYLLLHGDAPQPRERLAFMFWPDSQEAQARTNLRQALHLLRRALPEADRFLDSDGRSVRWRADAPAGWMWRRSSRSWHVPSRRARAPRPATCACASGGGRPLCRRPASELL